MRISGVGLPIAVTVPQKTRKCRSTFLEAELRNAIVNNELEVFYQPKVELSSGRIVGAEALVHWLHPSRGLIFPNQFIPLAEETGLIIPIGEFVLNTVCQQLHLWHSMGLFTQDFSVSVNLSTGQKLYGVKA